MCSNPFNSLLINSFKPTVKTTAVRALFLKYGQEIEAFLTRKLSCPHSAADLTQEVFLRVLRSGTNIQTDVQNTRAYLYKIAVNLAINHQSREQRLPMVDVDEDSVPESVDNRNPERITSDKQRLQRMSDALLELSPLSQKVFVLVRIRGMKQLEVARVLGIHITTVEKNLAKAVRHCYERSLEPTEQ
nr:RNA polymerase sigma factor [Pseudoteredinibacter isoporae]